MNTTLTHPTRPRHQRRRERPTASCPDPGEDARSPPEMVRPRDEAGRRVGRANSTPCQRCWSETTRQAQKTLAPQTERGYENPEDAQDGNRWRRAIQQADPAPMREQR